MENLSNNESLDTINVYFKNTSVSFDVEFEVQDLNDDNNVIIDQVFLPEEIIEANIVLKNNFGDVRYKRKDQDKWSNKSLIRNNDTVNLI